jgi:hypothetical protein
MKKILHLLVIPALLLSCVKKETISNEITDGNSLAIINNREEVINPLRLPGDKTLNINNLFELTIPEDFDIISIDQYLFLNRDNTQYNISNSLRVIYQNKFFNIRIDCIGNTDASILDGDKYNNLRKFINTSVYVGNQINDLKNNYIEDPFINENYIKISRFISPWGTSWTSDYYGLYFTLPNNEYTECVISIYNIWGTFAQNVPFPQSEKDYILKSKEEGGIIERIFQDLEFMENSITFTSSENSIKILNGSVGEEIIKDEYIFPTADNLRMRKQPSLTSEVLGYMENKIYIIRAIGEKTEIEGINGNWILVVPHDGNSAAWVFNGFTRKATSEEINHVFGE